MNVLVYVIDSLRGDHLSCYGHSRVTTPNIDAVAEDGLRYENCHSTSTWTRPVSVSLLTGAYPPAHGVRHREDLFPEDVDGLPRELARAGLRTVGVSTMGNVSSTLGYDVGFDRFVDLYKEEAIVERRDRVSAEDQQLVHEERSSVALPRSADINEYLLPILEEAEDGFFALCWSIDPHIPFDPPSGYREYLDAGYDGPVDGSLDSLPDDPSAADLAHLRNLYDGEIRYNDEQFGRLIDGLVEAGAYDDTLIVVLGDHGEGFAQHDALFHGNTPHEELVRVPLIVKPPGGRERPEVVSDLVSLVDVAPTVLDLLGVDGRLDHGQGHVLPPFGELVEDRAVFSDTQVRDVEPAYVSVRTGRWKYIRTEIPAPNAVLRRLYAQRESLPDVRYALATLRDSVRGASIGFTSERLYDLEADPGERTNLLDERPETASRLRDRLEAWQRDCADLRAGRTAPANADVDRDTREQLRELGYAD